MFPVVIMILFFVLRPRYLEVVI